MPVLRSRASACLLLAILSAASCALGAEFWYASFDDPSGLRFNGAASVTDCSDATNYNHTSLDDANDQNADSETPLIYSEAGGVASVSSIVTADTAVEVANVSRYKGVFPHRSSAAPAPRSACATRLRLTPSRPSRAGSVMRTDGASMLNGFEVGFAFQISDHSLACSQVRDRAFSLASYQSCAVNGGDGFAFVVHNDANASRALGAAASGLGYAGLRNALAIEFDTWYNTEPGVDDLLFDHVSVQASPSRTATMRGDAVVTEAFDTRLGPMRRVALADGRTHRAKIQYFPFIKYDLLPHFSASPNLLQFLVDDGEQWRLGTLVVFVDDMETPLLALPINLNAVLQLPTSLATVGFTASTGRAWQKHDIISWYLCELPGCPALSGQPSTVSYTAEG